MNSNPLKEQAFRVPEGYFDTLTARVCANVADANTKAAEQTRRRRATWVRLSLSLAASVTLLLGLSVAHLLNETQRSKQQIAFSVNDLADYADLLQATYSPADKTESDPFHDPTGSRIDQVLENVLLAKE